MVDLEYWLDRVVEAVHSWAADLGDAAPHAATLVDHTALSVAFEALADRLSGVQPYHHPRFVAEAVAPPHPAAVVGFLMGMLFSPDGSARAVEPGILDLEHEVVDQLSAMVGMTGAGGHLTASGTVANLEALFVARETHPGKAVAVARGSHVARAGLCRVLGVEELPVPVDDAGRIDLEALDTVVRSGRVGTIVLTAGNADTGAVDAVHEAVGLKERYGVRLHVDAAYGGFFALLAADGLVRPEPWAAIDRCDAVVVDPHQHGLQPVGSAAVLFADPVSARAHLDESPYGPHTVTGAHNGPDVSRTGAAVAALWLTLRLLPATPSGLGRLLAVTRRATLRLARLIDASAALRLYEPPDLDVVTFYPDESSVSAVDAATRRVLRRAARDLAEPAYLSALQVDGQALARRRGGLDLDAPHGRVLRGVMVKPEVDAHVDALHRRVEALAGTDRSIHRDQIHRRERNRP